MKKIDRILNIAANAAWVILIIVTLYQVSHLYRKFVVKEALKEAKQEGVWK